MLFGNNDELTKQVENLTAAIGGVGGELQKVQETLKMLAEQTANQSSELTSLNDTVKNHLEHNLTALMPNTLIPEYSQLLIQVEQIKMKRVSFESTLNILRASAFMSNDKDLKMVLDKMASDAYAGFNLATRLLTEKINAASQ